MATIAQIVAQIRTAVYGRDVRENIAQGIEKCYTDVTTGATAANAAAQNANTAAQNATSAAENVGLAITAANNAAQSANTAASTANESAGKINNMTVEASGLATGQNPTAVITEVEGHKHISFGIPKGDTGETPNLSIGTVMTLLPNQEASVTIGGTVDNPILNFRIPRGYDGSSVMSNRIWDCETSGNNANKVIPVTTTSIELEEGAMFIINFANKNIADYPTLNIGSTGMKSILINGELITTQYTKNLISGVCLFIYDGTAYNLVGNFYNSGADTIPDSEINELFEEE